jgi:hypothetical protein
MSSEIDEPADPAAFNILQRLWGFAQLNEHFARGS